MQVGGRKTTRNSICLCWDNKGDREEGSEEAPIIACYNMIPGNLEQSAEENVWFQESEINEKLKKL
jgi:hypothetical protein